MKRAIQTALAGWGFVSALIFFQFLWTYSRHGLPGFGIFMQEAVFTHIPITLASVIITWLLAGYLLWLLLTGRLNKGTALTWSGFFLCGFLYLNVLRERVRYGDIDYYTQAAFALVRGTALPDTYFYPPLWATLLSLLTPLGENGILLIAWTANVASLLLFYLLLHRTLELYDFQPRAAALITTLFILVNMPVLRTFMYVQVNFHVMNFILLSILFYKDRPLLSAAMLALAVHFKASPAVLVLAFLLELNWKWLAGFAVSLLLIAAFPLALYGTGPYYDFLNNFFFLNAPRGLSLHDSSFDSAIGMTLSYVRADFAVVQTLVLVAKVVTAAVSILLCLQTRGFVTIQRNGIRLYDSILPLFVGMTLLSPLVWEHHAVFLSLPFLLLLKKLEFPNEWILFGSVYLLIFLIPTFDFFPWSYGRLVGMLILLALLWVRRTSQTNTLFPGLNAWAEAAFAFKSPTNGI